MAFMDSSSVRAYLFGYLEEIIPENLMLFLKRMNSDERSKPTDSEDKQGSSKFTDSHWTEKDRTQAGDSEEQANDHHKFHEDQTKYTHSAHWTDTVLEIMNKTRIDIQNTWEQVRFYYVWFFYRGNMWLDDDDGLNVMLPLSHIQALNGASAADNF